MNCFFSGHVWGLCGNYNYVHFDDYSTRGGDYVGDNKRARAALVGNSWKLTESSDPG